MGVFGPYATCQGCGIMNLCLSNGHQIGSTQGFLHLPVSQKCYRARDLIDSYPDPDNLSEKLVIAHIRAVFSGEQHIRDNQIGLGLEL